MSTVGDNIRRIRKERNMTQKELGEKLGGISQQLIGQWETGKTNPKLGTLVKIATALDTELVNIFFESPTSVIDLTHVEDKEISKYLFSMFPDIKREYEEEKRAQKEAEEYLSTERLDEITLLYSQLNEAGQKEAVKRVSELTEIPRYRISDKPNTDE